MRNVTVQTTRIVVEDFCGIEGEIVNTHPENVRTELYAAWRKGDEEAPIAVRFELFFECHPLVAEPRVSTYDPCKDLMHCAG